MKLKVRYNERDKGYVEFYDDCGKHLFTVHVDAIDSTAAWDRILKDLTHSGTAIAHLLSDYCMFEVRND